MFAYCTETLHLSEAAAYLRIAAARASRAHPVLLTMLASGRLHLTAIAKLAPHLTPENRDRLLERAVHRTKRQIEELVAEIAPRPDVPALVRRLPERGSATAATRSTLASPGSPAGPVTSGQPERPRPTQRPRTRAWACSRVQPSRLRADCVQTESGLPARNCVQTQSREAGLSSVQGEPLRQGPSNPWRRAATRSSSPPAPSSATSSTGFARSCAPRCPTAIWRRSSTRPSPRSSSGSKPADSAGRRLPRKGPSAAQEPPSSRHVPAAVRRAVYERDGGRCRYVDDQGRRCSAREGLEFHHRHPFALGGHHSVDEMALLCRTHNGLLAEIDFGRGAVARHRRSDAVSRTPTVKPQTLFSP